jgi:hypothetical protein
MESAMYTITVPTLLRRALLLDGGASIVTGLAMSALAAPLASWLQLPAMLLLTAGLFAIGYGVLLVILSRRVQLPRWGVWSIVVGNLGWALGCVLLALGGWLAPNLAGVVFLLLQAAVVLAFADLQWLGLRRAPPTAEVWGQA